jgi:hypothetical protein
MLRALWKLLAYRFIGGRFLLAIAILDWIRRRIWPHRTIVTRSRSTTTTVEPNGPASRVVRADRTSIQAE